MACELDFNGKLQLNAAFNATAPKDYASAFACYASVQAYYPEAAWFMGYMAHRGLGTRRDDAKALLLLTAARKTVYAGRAEQELSLLYTDSDTVPHDPVKAVVLSTEAAYWASQPGSSCPWRSHDQIAADMRDEQYDLAATAQKQFRQLNADQKNAVLVQIDQVRIPRGFLLPDPSQPPPSPPMWSPCD